MDTSNRFSKGTQATQSQRSRLLSHLFPRRSSDNMKSSKRERQPSLGLEWPATEFSLRDGQPSETSLHQPTRTAPAMVTHGHSHTQKLSQWVGAGVAHQCSGDCLRLFWDTDRSLQEQCTSSQYSPVPGPRNVSRIAPMRIHWTLYTQTQGILGPTPLHPKNADPKRFLTTSCTI